MLICNTKIVPENSYLYIKAILKNTKDARKHMDNGNPQSKMLPLQKEKLQLRLSNLPKANHLLTDRPNGPSRVHLTLKSMVSNSALAPCWQRGPQTSSIEASLEGLLGILRPHRDSESAF